MAISIIIGIFHKKNYLIIKFTKSKTLLLQLTRTYLNALIKFEFLSGRIIIDH